MSFFSHIFIRCLKTASTYFCGIFGSKTGWKKYMYYFFLNIFVICLNNTLKIFKGFFIVFFRILFSDVWKLQVTFFFLVFLVPKLGKKLYVYIFFQSILKFVIFLEWFFKIFFGIFIVIFSYIFLSCLKTQVHFLGIFGSKTGGKKYMYFFLNIFFTFSTIFWGNFYSKFFVYFSQIFENCDYIFFVFLVPKLGEKNICIIFSINTYKFVIFFKKDFLQYFLDFFRVIFSYIFLRCLKSASTFFGYFGSKTGGKKGLLFFFSLNTFVIFFLNIF